MVSYYVTSTCQKDPSCIEASAPIVYKNEGLHWQNSASIYTAFGLSPRWIFFKNKLKPNGLINWLISQEMLLGIIKLRLMDMCCATKQFSATKISNRKIKFYLLSDEVFQQKSPRWIFLAGARDVVWYHCII